MEIQMIPLYGHNSEQTAYLVEDYPYGFRERCRIRFWLEKNDSKGFRFCSQTENPKTKRWNNPKRSTYSKIAGVMFLDEENHVQWTAISEYGESDKALQFVKNFPNADFEVLKNWCFLKYRACERLAKGETEFPLTEGDMERNKKEAEIWKEAFELIKERTVQNG